MKKFFLCLGVIAGIIAVSCSQNEDSLAIQDYSQPMNEVSGARSIVVERLAQLNDSIRYELEGESRTTGSRGLRSLWRKIINFVQSDIEGAVVGAIEGGQVGLAVGAFVGTPEIGGIAGVILGGTINGFISSYSASKRHDGCGIVVVPPIDETKMEYCKLRSEMSDEAVDDGGDCDVAKLDYLDLPIGAKSIEDVGRIHNKLLNKFLSRRSNKIAPNGLIVETPVVDDAWSISPIEMSILDSEELEQSYNDLVNDIFADNFHLGSGNYCVGEMVEDVIRLYYDILDQIPDYGGLNDVINITNQYIAVVAESDEISDEEKEVLYCAFAVGVYSYEYWSNYDFEE